MWPPVKKHRGIVFSKLQNRSIYHGLSKESLNCSITNFLTCRPCGYVVIPRNLIDSNLSDLKTTEEIIEMYQNYNINVHGGVTYVKQELNHILDLKDDVIVVGFDTSHSISPLRPDIEFMIDEVLKLAKSCYEIASNKERGKLYISEKKENEDDLSHVLRSIEEEARKLEVDCLPNINTYDNSKLYILELFRRIESGYTPDEELTEEEKQAENQEFFKTFTEMFSTMI